MSAVAGSLGDSHRLTSRARKYANDVIFGAEWPLTPDHVDLDCLTFETSTRMKRKHGICITQGEDRCTVRLSERTYDRAGFEAIQETIRHELVHVYQHQTAGVEMGHGQSFKQWVEPLNLDGRCSQHYEVGVEDYSYTFHCPNCGFIGGRHRMCKTVRAGIDGELYCQQCDSVDVGVRDEHGVVLTDRNHNNSC
ncbi:SprT-like domain-containing protein [Halobacteriaceae archaeon SHR40]|uniref:SprT-like domain-containing protein n=1 Tax=Halovenus amylolytica TaxID=2500550 RepID=UPI000FE36A90